MDIEGTGPEPLGERQCAVPTDSAFGAFFSWGHPDALLQVSVKTLWGFPLEDLLSKPFNFLSGLATLGLQVSWFLGDG
jgi:hypothetical protein